MPILPRRIEFGDTLGLICPASAPADPKVVDHSIAALEKMGFKVKLAKNSRKRWGFLAGHDRERAADVMQMFLDERVRGIVCLRGGYGTPRILPLLDYQKIREHPKVFVGFSDITALHCAFLKKSNLLSFHGPMTASHFTDAKSPAFSLSSWLNVMMNPKPAGSITHGYEGKTVKVLRGGKVSGDLVGGNISLLTSLIGTPFQCSYRGKILFLEDVAEEPYRLDRMLTQLLNAGLLQQVAGVAIGLCHQCEDPPRPDRRGISPDVGGCFRGTPAALENSGGDRPALRARSLQRHPAGRRPRPPGWQAGRFGHHPRGGQITV